jgi:endopeptidase La
MNTKKNDDLNSNILKCNILKKEYKILSNILCNLQDIIIQNEYILLFSKNQTMKSLNDLVKKLNELYNIEINEVLGPNDDNQLSNESLYSDITDIKSEENKSEENKSEENKSDDQSNSEKDKSLYSDLCSEISNENIDKLICEKTKKNRYFKNSIDIDSYDPKQNVNLELINDYKKLLINSSGCQLNIFTNNYNYLDEYIKYEPLKEIKEQIINLSKIVGFTSIDDIIYLVLGVNNFDFIISSIPIKKLLDQVLRPLDFELSSSKDNSKDNFNDNSSHIKITKTELSHIVLFNNTCKIEFSIGDKLFIIKGYIKSDPLDIFGRTSEISNAYLFNKKNKMKKIINLITLLESIPNDKTINTFGLTTESLLKLSKINKSFADVYMKNMTTPETIILDETQFINKMYEDFNKFNELSKIQFVKLIKLFTKDANDNLYTMFNTIKLLLMGNQENCSVASLLFNLLKDKKNSNSNEFISNIIYNQLNHLAQLKLKKSTFNIKNELDKLKGITSSDVDLKKQVILSKHMPDHIKKICLEKLDELKNANNETYKIKMYVNILIQFPWPSETDDNVFKVVASDKKKSKEFLENVESKLDNQIFGHKLAKNKTLQILAKLISVQGSHISPIALSGPPGVGKTKFAQVLADCLDIPFVQITLGGQNDGELLHGHGYTYSGAQPGLIVKKMVDAGSARCIMYFDELDKCVAKNGQVNELMSILIHLTDPMTNGAFQDRFFQEITFPLNKVIFMFSFNDVSKIDKILLDRMEVLDVGSYSIKEKITISNDYLLKQLCKEIGFEYGSLIFNPEVLSFIVEEYTFEPGVRSLKRSLENILLKLNIDKIYQRGLFENDAEYSIDKPLKITNQIATEFLGETKVTFKSIHPKDMIGVVNGLYATSLCSGGIVPIQLTGNHLGKNSKFVLKLTGNQKKIMKESILYSFTTAINLLTNEGKEIFFKNYSCGIHIHTPEAATPKDGPSAGVAFTLAFLSVMLDLPIDRTIALTGEIDLYGNVTKIGGVKYKTQGAIKAGVKTIFLPVENKEDLEKTQKELPEIFTPDIKCFFIEHVLEVAEKALVGWDNKKHYIKL